MKRSFRFALVDAFSTKPLGGNPCAVVFDADALTADEMLAIAKEMNQSETAFVLKSKNAELKARYFTPEREIPLAGHPTIATVHAACEAGLLDAKQELQSLKLDLNDGPIDVQIDRSGQHALIRMFQRKPVFSQLHDVNTVLPLFGLNASDLMPGAVIQTVSTGTRQLMVPLRRHDSLKRVMMNVPAYREYREQCGFFSPHLFCLGGISADAQTFARHPGMAPDTAEDAFTGSATGGMAVAGHAVTVVAGTLTI